MMENFCITMNFKDPAVIKQYSKSLINYFFRKTLGLWIFMVMALFYTFIRAYTTSPSLYDSPFFKVFCLGSIVLALCLFFMYYIKYFFKRKIRSTLYHEMIFVFSETGLSIYVKDIPEKTVTYEYNSQLKIQTTKKEILISISSRQMLILPRNRFSKIEQDQLTQWLKAK